jgi:hypothetical protein
MSDKKRVVVTIRRGIPEVIEAPDGVDVEIWDYDTDGVHPDNLSEDDDGEEYILREG